MAITSDKLTWIYTTYGLNRLAAALNNSTDNLYLYKFKIGNANYSYYTPSVSATDLVNPITNGTFYINSKSINTEGDTVEFKTTFPENSNGYEIWEIGLYETIDDIDYLFAIGTCQPIVKPNLSDNYVISIDYSLKLKSVNLSSVYDQIKINPDYEYASQEDLDNLQTTILYVEGNLMEQISSSSHIIGLNRAAQLQEKQENDIMTYSNLSTSLNYSNIANFTDIDNITSYWVFNYSRYTSINNSVVDFGNSAINLSLNKNINLFTRGYMGLAPYLNIDDSNYFYLNSDIDFNLLNSSNTAEVPFTMLFLLKNNILTTKCTLLAKSNYSTHNHVFEINKTANNSIQVKLFKDKDNYITFTTAENIIPNDFYFLALKYNGNYAKPSLDVFVNTYKKNTVLITTGTYTGTSNIPEKLTSYTINSSGNPQDYANSTYSIVSLIKDSLTDYQIKSIALNMLSLTGKDTCLVI